MSQKNLKILYLKILYQDEAVIVVEKPAGVPCLAKKPSEQDPQTLEGWLQKIHPRAKLVHRLDNDTSGIMVAAKTPEAHKKLREIWNTPLVEKKYLALVQGKTPAHGKIDTPIAHHPRKKKKMITGGLKAKAASTIYKTLKYLKDQSLIEVTITTGHRHQIRIHLASLGYPIVGDKIYQKNPEGLPHHYLHLSQLTCPHPTTQKKMSFSSQPDWGVSAF